MKRKNSLSRNESGMVLLSAVVFLSVLVLAASTAFLTATTELKMGGNYKHGEQAYYSALAGCEEAKARLRFGAAHPIQDDEPGEATWRVYVGSMDGAGNRGFDPKNEFHIRVAPLASDLNCTVEIRHPLDASGHVLLWGDADGDGTRERNTKTGETIYLITSSYAAAGLNKVIQAEAARMPSLPVPGALYVKSMAIVQGSNTVISGIDRYTNQDIAGVATTGEMSDVAIVGAVEISGRGGEDPNVQYQAENLDLETIINGFEKSADFSYTISEKEQSPTDVPGPGDGWGNLVVEQTAQAPFSCSDARVIHYKTDGAGVRFLPGVTGCGLLLVEGDLEVSGDFTWYGPIVATGSIFFSGGGDKQITGAVLAGDSALVGEPGSRTNIVYSTEAVNAHTINKPLHLLSWMEVM